MKTLTASGVDGRWASGGRLVIYCAESIALAVLENMVRRQGAGFNNDYKTLLIEIPDTTKIETITTDMLPAGWNDFRNYSVCQQFGNQWYDGMHSAVLRVPSAVLPVSNNFVLNSSHPGFTSIKIVDTTDFIPDERIEDLLKRYQ